MMSSKLLAFITSRRFNCCVLSGQPQKWYSNIYQERRQEKRRPIYKALSQFDDFYGSLFKDEWPSIRVALLCKEKRGIIVNNFGDKDRVCEEAEKLGAYNIRKIYSSLPNSSAVEDQSSNSARLEPIYQMEGSIEKTLLKCEEEERNEIYPGPLNISSFQNSLSCETDARKPDLTDDDRGQSLEDPSKDKPLAETLKSAHYDDTRIILPGSGNFSPKASLYEYIPSTKLKGLDDYISESEHYRFYRETEQAPTEYECETAIEFPQVLDVYAYERGNCDTFERSANCSTDVLAYHIFQLGYLAPVLALGMKSGDVVLDLTSSTLDIPMLIHQSLIPKTLVVNCDRESRASYVLRYLNSFLFDTDNVQPRLLITDYHPLLMKDEEKYDKIIVTVPSTSDRLAVTRDEENLFRPTSVKSRINLPILQSSYLKRALQLVKPGGTVVYCTETLSPIQNDGVVKKVLDEMWLDNQKKFIIKDLSAGLRNLESFMKISKSGKYGHLVVPFLPSNCGPLYFSKIVKKNDEV